MDQLSLFVDVFGSGGFAAVARNRGIAPSSVSRAIATLEEELGVLLFQRSNRTLTATQAGVAFHDRIAPLLEEFAAATEEARGAEAAPAGLLRLSASTTYGQIVLAPHLGAFRQRYPNVTLELVLSDRRVDLVSERIDLAIRHGDLPDSALVARKLQDVRYHLVASRRYLDHAGKLHSPTDLHQHSLLAFPYDGFRSHWSFEQAGQYCVVPIHPTITISNAAALAECVRQGLGIGLLADWAIRSDLADGTLVDVLPHWRAAGANADSAIWLVYPTRRLLPTKVRHFIDWISTLPRSGS